MVRTTTRSYFGAFAVLAAMALLCVLASSSGAAAGDTIHIAGGYSPDISDDGRFVAFFSGAGIDVRDRDTDEDGIFDEAGAVSTERVDVDDSGVPANDYSLSPSISDDGRYVAFESAATNLVPNDTNGVRDVFVHDLQTRTTQRVSVDSSGTQANGESRGALSLSADGRFVAFPSEASNIVADDTNNYWDFFVRDRDIDEDGIFDEEGAVSTERVNVDDSGNQARSPNGVVIAASISPNGRYVGFTTSSSNLVPVDTNNTFDVFVRDLQAGTIVRASVDSLGNQGNWGADSPPSISNDGHVAFSSSSTNLVPNDTNTTSDVFVHDLQTGTTQRVSVSSSGTQGDGVSGYWVSISSDGSVVSFDSVATNLVPNDTNGVGDVFVRDLQAGTTERASVSSSGTQANGMSYGPSISAAGRFVAFSSNATNLVSGETNGAGVFVHELGTIADTTSPRVSTTNPANKATRIAPTVNVRATFSEAMDPTTITGKTFKLLRLHADGTTTKVTASLTYDATTKTAILDTARNLKSGATYKATVTTGARDLAGNQLDQNSTKAGDQGKIWKFTVR